jgi:hypothetical protein
VASQILKKLVGVRRKITGVGLRLIAYGIKHQMCVQPFGVQHVLLTKAFQNGWHPKKKLKALK